MAYLLIGSDNYHSSFTWTTHDMSTITIVEMAFVVAVIMESKAACRVITISIVCMSLKKIAAMDVVAIVSIYSDGMNKITAENSVVVALGMSTTANLTKMTAALGARVTVTTLTLWAM